MCYTSRASSFRVTSSKAFCFVACSETTDIKMDRTEHHMLENLKVSNKFTAVCIRSSTVWYTQSRICFAVRK
jgi:hypothetical protein